MKAYLAIYSRYHDAQGRKMNLLEFDSVNELDKYTKNFTDSSQIKKKFQREIQEYIMDDYLHGDNAIKETKDGRPIVYLTAYVENKHKAIRFIDVMYKDSKDIVILKISEIVGKMRYIIEKIKTYGFKHNRRYKLKEYIRALNIFQIPLSECERDLLKKYAYYDNEKALDSMIAFLKNDLARIDKNKAYGYLRFNKKELQKAIAMINEKYNIYRELIEQEHQSDEEKIEYAKDLTDERFQGLVDDRNYEQLFNEYDLDEIVCYIKNWNGVERRRK